jgi:glycine oxidase
MTDCCIIGGGVVGLSIARELAGRGLSVRVVTRELAGDTASWAAAGILPPAPEHPAATANERLTAWSDRLHRQWSVELRDETGIDNELVACGGLHLARDARSLDRLRGVVADWRARGVRCEELSPADVAKLEPALGDAVASGLVVGGLWLPDEQKIRPPRHLEALRRSCLARGVAITPAAAVRGIEVQDGAVLGLVAGTGAGGAGPTFRAGAYVLAAGAWSAGLAESLGLRLETRPIRGQIVLLRLRSPVLERLVNVGIDYFVPRDDGRLLVGSTIEDAGFRPTTTPEAVTRLLALARRMLGPLPEAEVERSWAGLRPGSVDGLPTIGRVPGCRNAFVATGHFRAGVHQSTGTALLMADLITGRAPAVDPAPFAPDREPLIGGPDSVEAFLARATAEA